MANWSLFRMMDIFDASYILNISSATYTPDSNKDYSFWFFFFDFFCIYYIMRYDKL